MNQQEIACKLEPLTPGLFFGRYALRELPPFDGEQLGHVRSFIAEGPRGASYGCLVYPDGSWRWSNLKGPWASVPFDLAQVSPLSEAS